MGNIIKSFVHVFSYFCVIVLLGSDFRFSDNITRYHEHIIDRSILQNKVPDSITLVYSYQIWPLHSIMMAPKATRPNYSRKTQQRPDISSKSLNTDYRKHRYRNDQIQILRG